MITERRYLKQTKSSGSQQLSAYSKSTRKDHLMEELWRLGRWTAKTTEQLRF